MFHMPDLMQPHGEMSRRLSIKIVAIGEKVVPAEPACTRVTIC